MPKAHEVIKEFGRGSLDDQLTAAINEVAGAVALTGKPGSVSLKLGFTEKAGMVIVSTTVASTPPKQKNEQGYFVGDDGGITRRDPNQPQLPAPVGEVDAK